MEKHLESALDLCEPIMVGVGRGVGVLHPSDVLRWVCTV